MLFGIIVTILGCSVVAAKVDNARILVSQKGLDFAEDVAFYMVDILQDVAADTLKLPNVYGGKFEAYSLKFKSLDLGKPEITIVPDVGIKMRMPAAKITVTGSWAIQTMWWNYGTMEMDANMRIEAIAGIKAENGRLVTTSEGSSVHFNSFALDLNNAFFTWIAGMMESSITPEISGAIRKEINKLLDTTINTAMKVVPNTIPIAGIMSVNFENLSPVFKSSYLSIPSTVKAMDASGNPVSFPFSPDPMIDNAVPNHMMCTLLSDYTLNTAAYIALGPGKIRESVPNAQIKADNEILNTLFYKTSLPQLYNAHPDTPLKFTLVNTRFPSIEFNTGHVILDMPLTLSLVTDTDSDILDLEMQMTVQGSVSRNNNVITGTVSSAAHTTTVKSSQIGNIDIAQLSGVLDTIIDNTILPEVNRIFGLGIVLPIDKFLTLNSGLLEVREDFLKICCDITLTDFSLAELKKIVENIV